MLRFRVIYFEGSEVKPNKYVNFHKIRVTFHARLHGRIEKQIYEHNTNDLVTNLVYYTIEKSMYVMSYKLISRKFTYWDLPRDSLIYLTKIL